MTTARYRRKQDRQRRGARTPRAIAQGGRRLTCGTSSEPALRISSESFWRVVMNQGVTKSGQQDLNLRHAVRSITSDLRPTEERPLILIPAPHPGESRAGEIQLQGAQK